MLSMAIWYLGGTVILVNTPNPAKYLFLGSYTLTVSIYHLVNYIAGYQGRVYNVPRGAAMIGIWVASAMLLMGLLLTHNASLVLLNVVAVNDGMTALVNWLVWFFFFLKIVNVANLYSHLAPSVP